MLEEMAIEAVLIVVIMIGAFIFAYILTAVIGEWRADRRARSAQRQRHQRHTQRAAPHAVT